MLPGKYYELVCCRNYRKAINVMLVSFGKWSTGVEKQKINPSMWGLEGVLTQPGVPTPPRLFNNQGLGTVAGFQGFYRQLKTGLSVKLAKEGGNIFLHRARCIMCALGNLFVRLSLAD